MKIIFNNFTKKYLVGSDPPRLIRGSDFAPGFVEFSRILGEIENVFHLYRK